MHISIEGIGPVVLNSPEIREIYKQALILHHDRSIPVLIEGETGTGKELVARYIHFYHHPETCYRPFIAINCSTLSPSLFESEVFGYEAGAFTGAFTGGRKGKYDLADGGTLFFDEISELPLKSQAKLLRVLQEKKYYRLGGLKPIYADVRIICATNKNLEEMIQHNRFRSDLYYRLCTAHIRIPPLRERKADIIPLSQIFLLECSRQRNKNFNSISSPAAKWLCSHPWPGNVRQLRNVMERITLFHDEKELRAEHLNMLQKGQRIPEPSTAPASRTDWSNFALPPDRLPLEALNRSVIQRALQKHSGNISKTAQYLDISHRSLSYKMKKWGLFH